MVPCGGGLGGLAVGSIILALVFRGVVRAEYAEYTEYASLNCCGRNLVDIDRWVWSYL